MIKGGKVLYQSVITRLMNLFRQSVHSRLIITCASMSRSYCSEYELSCMEEMVIGWGTIGWALTYIDVWFACSKKNGFVARCNIFNIMSEA